MTTEDDTQTNALKILGLVQSCEQTPMGKVWGINAKTLREKLGLSETDIDDLLDALLSIGDLRIHPDNRGGFVLGSSGKERLSQTTPDTAEDETEDLDEITLTPSQTEAIHASIKHASKPHADITEGLEAWVSAKRAITKTIEYGGFNSPLASITVEDALKAVESASSLADRLRVIADILERESESYRHEIEAMR